MQWVNLWMRKIDLKVRIKSKLEIKLDMGLKISSRAGRYLLDQLNLILILCGLPNLFDKD